MQTIFKTLICLLIVVCFTACATDDGPLFGQDSTQVLVSLWLPSTSGGNNGGVDGNGGDDDDPVIQGVVQNTNQELLATATVRIVDATAQSTEATVVTDSVGQFDVAVTPGTYYFEVDASGYALQQSDSVLVEASMYSVLEVQ